MGIDVRVDYMPKEIYTKLLQKFCFDEELMKLLEESVLDNQRARERFYLHNGKYPELRDGLNKLIYDLISTKAVEIQNKIGGNKNEREV